jgi:hypothetical protein
MTTAIQASAEQPGPERADAGDVGTRLLSALAQQDFQRLRELFADDLRARALLPTGLVELDGPDAATERLQRWFGRAAELTLLEGTAEPFADILHVGYRLSLEEHPFQPGSGPQLIEQHLLCRVEDGRIEAFDLVCSGFRPGGAE